MKLTAVLSLTDNYTDTLKHAIKKTQEFRDETEKTRKVLVETYNHKYKIDVDTNHAAKKVKQFSLMHFKGISIEPKIIISPSEILKTMTGLKSLFKTKPQKVQIIPGSMDGFLNVIKGAASQAQKLLNASLKGAANSLKGAANAEENLIGVEHIIGVNNKGASTDQVKKQAEDYVKGLRADSGLASFENSDVQSTGSQALAMSKGNTAEAANLMKMSADMAALSPGKSLSDALEALAALKKGDADALKDFHFEADETSIAAAGGDLGKVKNKSGMTLGGTFEGGAAKKAASANGMAMGVKNSLKNSLADLGKDTLDVVKPEMQQLLNFLNGSSARKMLAAGSKMMSGLAKGIFEKVHGIQSWISSKFLNNMDFQNLPDLKSKIFAVLGELKNAFDGWYETSGKGLISGLISNGVQLLVKSIPMFLETALKIGVAIVEGLASGLKELGSAGIGWFKGIFGMGGKEEEKGTASKEPPKKAIGLARVPYDNYPALLHQNERVLTASEARSVDRTGAPVIINLTAGKTVDPDIGRLMAALKTAVESAGFNMAPGGATA
ncbi:MAG: hypothetical protein K0Q90_644 [Paenibacillaceae bacterium]|jgi:hypothetical protein|nr:hypothetical protein [Paenibacillaceae bacterium]